MLYMYIYTTSIVTLHILYMFIHYTTLSICICTRKIYIYIHTHTNSKHTHTYSTCTSLTFARYISVFVSKNPYLLTHQSKLGNIQHNHTISLLHTHTTLTPSSWQKYIYAPNFYTKIISNPYINLITQII